MILSTPTAPSLSRFPRGLVALRKGWESMMAQEQMINQEHPMTRLRSDEACRICRTVLRHGCKWNFEGTGLGTAYVYQNAKSCMNAQSPRVTLDYLRSYIE